MKFKFGIKQLILAVVAVLLIAVLVVGNILLDANSITLHKVFNSISGNNGYDSTPSTEAYATGDAMVSQLVEDSVVLFRNEDNALPLSTKSESQVNLFGWNATTKGFLLSGTGSGGSPVLDRNRVDLAQAFTEAGYEYNKELYDAYATQSGAGNATINNIGQQSATSMNSIYNPGESFYADGSVMQQARDYSSVAIVVLSRNTGENCGAGETLNFTNYNNGAWLELTANEKLMLDQVTEWFSDGKVIVLLNTTNTMELGFLEDYDIDAALYIGAPGQSGARAIPHLLYGEKTEKDTDGNEQTVQISPSGRTSDTYAYNYNLVDGKNYSASWTSAISNGGSIYYQEGIYVGYKWYETADAEGFFADVDNVYGKGYDGIVQYPFGYGMSYTNFKWHVEEWPSADKLTLDGKYEVKVRVKNTGNYPGKDVVELYFTPPYEDGGIEKAAVNLLAFAKTNTLAPQESQVVTLKFSAYDLASYDDYDKNSNGFSGYELDAGDHVLKLMNNSHDVATLYDANFEKEVTDGYKHALKCDGVKFEKDPVTGTDVGNLFTGSNAYSGTPIDGSTAFNGGIDYLSRAGKFANFPKEVTFTCKARSNNPSQTYEAVNEWKDVADLTGVEYGQDAQMYLVTDSDGNKVTNFNNSNITLKNNTELMEDLWDYDSESWTPFLNQLTQQEINTLIGQGKFQTKEVLSVGKPFCKELDGPAGFNENSSGAASDPNWVVFPVEALLGCSWNAQSTYNMGKAMGLIGAETGVHGWYGPGLNIHRSPYYGRNFEYYSEDAVLTGKLVAECIRGAKQNNLTCYMKHFVCADTGPNSTNWYTWLTEQTFREIYLKPFEIAVKEGGANAVMSGFSAVGANWAGSNWAVSTQVLRNEWGFRGSVITDWENGYMDKARGIKGGNDLWLGQSGTSFKFNDTVEAYCARQSAKNILYTYIDCYMTAKTYQDAVANGEYDDPYAANVDKPMVGVADFSPLFVGLWVGVDVLLGLGIVLCVVFFFLNPKGKKTEPEVEIDE